MWRREGLITGTFVIPRPRFYGISFSFAKLSGDPYLNLFLSSIIEAPAILFGYFCTDFFGRKFMLAFLQVV